MMHRWLLPEHIEDILPNEARQIEQWRRQLLDLFNCHGYQYVIPPMLEYVESLTTGVGHDLDIATFKVVDQLSGRLMGVRADITPQAARIDAHLMNQAGVTRLCYAGSVLRTMAEGAIKTREPIQVGAELFGYGGVEGDIEIQSLMVKALRLLGCQQILIDFSHVGIFTSLLQNSQMSEDSKQALQQALQIKDQAKVKALLANTEAGIRTAIVSLLELNGDSSVLDEAEKRLPKTSSISAAIAQLRCAAEAMQQLGVKVCIDLSEQRGYQYHSGMLFSAYVAGSSAALALGGRYDNVGEVFGRARCATGFSLDLRGFLPFAQLSDSSRKILAPYDLADAALQQRIADLRSEGNIVIVHLPGQQASSAEACQAQLVKQDGQWQVQAIA